MPTCPSCRKYLHSPGICPQCGSALTTGIGTRAFATKLRAQVAVPQHISAQTTENRFWGPVTGEVRREQETWTGRARGTTALTVAGLSAPLLVAICTGSTTPGDTVGAVVAALAVFMLPLALLVILMSLGRGGPLSFLGRLAGNTVNVGMGMGSRHQPRRGGPGRILIIGQATSQSRVEVARPLDVPIGSTVTVHGPRVSGYRHAWFIRVHGLDTHTLPTRGVLLACASTVLGCTLTVLALIAGIGGALQ